MACVRTPLLAATILAAVVWPNEARSTLVSAAAVLVEALPFLLAGILIERTLRARSPLVAYAGCGCTAGPSARSLPAAALAWLSFGPLCALARVGAATVVDRALRGKRKASPCAHEAPDLAAELQRLVPFAVAAGMSAQLALGLHLSHANVLLQVAAGSAMGFFASPCAIGSIAVAAALRVHAPAAAASFLCVAGIVDLHALIGDRAPARNGDAFAYALLAVGVSLIAFRHGAALVRPSFAPALAVCTVAAAALAVARRTTRVIRVQPAPVIILLGALVAAPPPAYNATETTLAEIFPGEHLSFTGTLTRDKQRAALVRYAITCCRADAAPVVVRLLTAPNLAPGTWTRADGTIVETPSGFALSEERVTQVPSPADPFLYR